MNINTVIQEIKETLDILQEQRFDDSFIDAGGLLQIESENMKLQALQEKAARENPHPLTLEELREMEGEPVYVVCLQHTPLSCWGYVTDGCVIGYHANFGFSEYSKVWTAYRTKPKEEER